MGTIKRRFLYCLSGTILCAIVSIGFAFSTTWSAVIVFAAAAIILMLITIKMAEHYQSARLICENPILNVGLASVSETLGGAAESTVNVVVSGFGILMDGKPFKFGHGGIDLKAVRIDRESITFSFGGEDRKYSVRLLHGIAEKAEIEKLTARLRYETGVVANVTGW